MSDPRLSVVPRAMPEFLSRLLCLCFLCGAATLSAQPKIAPWSEQAPQPSSFEQSAVLSIQVFADCERPSGTILPGDTLGFEIDTLGGFTNDVRLDELPVLTRGRARLSVDDNRVVFTVFERIDAAGFDTIRVVACRTDDDCREQDFIVGIGVPGRRDTVDIEIGSTRRAAAAYLQPAAERFCESVTNVGFYEGANRRRTFFDGDSLRYRSTRTPGIDVLQVVVCDIMGTCDTTIVSAEIVTNTVGIPFCDDFSYDGPRPNAAVWLEDDVFVNTAFAVAPPSIGVATFDGLDESGSPYGNGIGPSDVLTSTAIDLSEQSGNVFLKYFLQIGGLGQAPERMDVMYVEGRRSDGLWAPLDSHRGSATSTPERTFSYYQVELTDELLYHEGFQVRFRTNGNRSGEFDNWNLDYVRVEEGSDSTFADIALTQQPSPLLAPYTAVPYEQFAVGGEELVQSSVTVGVFNHFAETNNVSSSRVEVIDAQGKTLLDAALLSGSQFNLEPGFAEFANPIPSTPLANFRNELRSLDRDGAKRLTTRYTLGIDSDQDRLDCVLRNDTAETVTIVDDYYAYDDGSAEAGFFNGGVGERIVVRYEAFVQDTLRGLRFRFPRLGPLDAERQLINLQVYIGELDDEPEFEEELVRPYFPSSVQDTNQAFTTFRLQDILKDPVDLIIPPGPFYVGWQQASDVDSPVPVGLDLSSDNTDAIFVNFGADWLPVKNVLNQLQGSLMIRPVFSSEVLENSSSTQNIRPQVAELRAAPNPTTSTIRLLDLPSSSLGGSYIVLDATGRQVAAGPLQPEIDVAAGAAPGLRIVVVRDKRGAVVGSVRVLVR